MNKTLGLYVHIPFCVRKCNYCDFLSKPGNEDEQRQYARALFAEIDRQGIIYEDYKVDSIFIGGGTPTCLSEEILKELLERLHHNFHIMKDCEISMECNPGTAGEHKLSILRETGVNRLSIGLQSTSNEELKCLGRIHTYEEFLEVFQAARNVGFDNINVDLMGAIPGQTLDGYMAGLRKIIELNPEHISAYSLIIEEGTPFFEKYSEHPPVDEDTDRAIYGATKEILEKYGYHRYEISNYARENRECKHNVKYWTRADYLGLGLGAASLVESRRFRNTTDYQLYETDMNKQHYIEEEKLSREDEMSEFMFLGLRLCNGISRKRFLECFGQDIDNIYKEVLDKLVKEQILVDDGEHIYLTDYGLDVSNYAMYQFLL